MNSDSRNCRHDLRAKGANLYYLQNAHLYNVVLSILRPPAMIWICNANNIIIQCLSNVSLLALISIMHVNNCKTKIRDIESILERNETFPWSCWVEMEEKSSEDGKDIFTFLVFFHLFQKILRESPDEE